MEVKEARKLAVPQAVDFLSLKGQNVQKLMAFGADCKSAFEEANRLSKNTSKFEVNNCNVILAKYHFYMNVQNVLLILQLISECPDYCGILLTQIQ